MKYYLALGASGGWSADKLIYKHPHVLLSFYYDAKTLKQIGDQYGSKRTDASIGNSQTGIGKQSSN
jgi:hypothetical protein